MAAQNLSDANRSFIILRRNILKYLLSSLFKKYPYSSIELGEIAEFCQTSAEELNWNIVYLEKHGWVELAKSIPCPPYVACSAGLTASGIDLIEMPMNSTSACLNRVERKTAIFCRRASE